MFDEFIRRWIALVKAVNILHQLAKEFTDQLEDHEKRIKALEDANRISEQSD